MVCSSSVSSARSPRRYSSWSRSRPRTSHQNQNSAYIIPLLSDAPVQCLVERSDQKVGIVKAGPMCMLHLLVYLLYLQPRRSKIPYIQNGWPNAGLLLPVNTFVYLCVSHWDRLVEHPFSPIPTHATVVELTNSFTCFKPRSLV